MRVTITPTQRKHYTEVGLSLIRHHVTSGFQLEDFDPHSTKQALIYGHDNPGHIHLLQRTIGGRIFPRESHYRFEPQWKEGANTVLTHGRTFAHERGLYLQTTNVQRGARYVRNRAVRGLSRHPLRYSWEVPDVRYEGTTNPFSRGIREYAVTKRIDPNSRFQSIVTTRTKAREIQKALPHSHRHPVRVKRVWVQDYPKHSFHNYLKEMGS